MRSRYCHKADICAAPAGKPIEASFAQHSLSPPPPAPVMPPDEDPPTTTMDYVDNGLLFFIANKINFMVHEDIIEICKGFYNETDIAGA